MFAVKHIKFIRKGGGRMTTLIKVGKVEDLRELYRGKITKGPSRHGISVSLCFNDPVAHPSEISLPFCIDPPIKNRFCSVTAFHIVVIKASRDVRFQDWEIEGRFKFPDSIDSIPLIFGVEDPGFYDYPDFRVFITYSTLDRVGEVVVAIPVDAKMKI